MEKNYVVYCHTAPNGKKYIGITRQKPTKRWNNGKGYYYNIHFNRAIKKYGWDNFRHEIIAENLTQEEASETEKKYIAKYNTTNPKYGFNITTGGEKGYQLTDDCLHKLSKAHKKLNKDGRNKKRNIGGANPCAKVVYQYTKQGTFIAEYSSVSEAARFFVLSGKSKSFESARISIMNAANHRLIAAKGKKGKKIIVQSAYGYKWSYLEKIQTDCGIVIKKRSSRTRSILQYSKCGKYIKTYDSIKEAADRLGVKQAHITQCAKGQRISAHGYLWAYDDTENIENFISDKVKAKMHGGKMWSGSNHQARPVKQYDFDGNYIQTFQTITDAARALGISPSNISGCAGNKKNITAGGFVWKYA